jgi:hypothetical protein
VNDDRPEGLDRGSHINAPVQRRRHAVRWNRRLTSSVFQSGAHEDVHATIR